MFNDEQGLICPLCLDKLHFCHCAYLDYEECDDLEEAQPTVQLPLFAE